MRPPKKEFYSKSKLDTSDSFYDQEYGWIKRMSLPCPKCKAKDTMALLEDHGFFGYTNCSYVELLPDVEFMEGGYTEARKILETLYDENRVEKPVQ